MELNIEQSMANRSKTVSFRVRKLKVCRRRKLLKDRLSELPDDVKVKVLSLLTMKEAGRTSVLSKRWRYVWAYIRILNFDDSDTLYKLMLEVTSLEVEQPKHVRWVNQVVGSYRGSTIDEFRVQFDLAKNSENNIDNWVNFAMEKRVKRLEMDFDAFEGGSQSRCYTFRGLSVSERITSLKLASINVNGEVIQNFLKSCPSLEYLSVKRSKSLLKLEVSGVKLNLKYLEICFCFEIQCIEICAPNLLSFKYFGPKINMPLKNTPKLATLFIGGPYASYLTNNFLELRNCLLQLEELGLDLSPYGRKSFNNFPLCERLKRLELDVQLEDEDLFCYVPIIKACPFLHDFVLKLTWGNSFVGRKHLEVTACRHEHLKIIKIIGFAGNAIDMEFIMYLIASCVALEKIVVDCRNPALIGTPSEFEGVNKKRILKHVKKLRAKLGPRVELLII